MSVGDKQPLRKEETMNQARYLYSELASTVDAMHRCERNPEQYGEWATKHAERISQLVRDHMPSGSGIDCGTTMDTAASHAEKLVFACSFHHMNNDGYYCGWTGHTITATPSFNGINLRIFGRNVNNIKDYLHDVYRNALCQTITK